jgi:electron transport complex protein RnfC
MLKSFHGGIWLDLNKSPAVDRPIDTLAAPARPIFPLLQHKGESAVLCVKKGNKVQAGQPLGSAGAGNSAAVHSSVSGRVIDIIEYKHPLGGDCMAVVVENDGNDTPYEYSTQNRDIKAIPAAEIMAHIRKAAIASNGGIDFPLWSRLTLMEEKEVDTLVINAVEAEPYICSAQKLMDEYPEDIAYGISCIVKALHCHNVILAVSDDYKNEADDVIKSAHLKGIEIKLARVWQKYPSGYEKYLFKILTGTLLKNNSIPEDMHYGFVFAEDCFNVCKAVKHGVPKTTKMITVSGGAIGNPQNLEVKLGTTVHDIIEHCGLILEPERIVLGSAMRGIAINNLNLPIIKPVTAILALTGKELRSTSPRCINCGKCVKVCPERLLPNYIAQGAVNADIDLCRELNILDCIECGSCAYICPGRMPIVELIKNIKRTGILET